jgi:alpha-amylase/alpha-mannosidase (GH57 family)
MLWINFLHIYQPANSDGHAIKEAAEKSYYRIVRALEEHPRIKFTMNISGCLFLRFEELGYQDLIKRIGNLVKRGQIELTGTAAYHPIIPLIPEKEAIAQIRENEEILKRHFGADFKPKGFFFPEMAYSPEAARLVKSLGYEWLILDEIAVNGLNFPIEFGRVYLDKNSELKVVVRSREFSKSYVPDAITALLDEEDGKEMTGPVITGTDGEIYGLRHEDQTAVFEKLLSRKDFDTDTISNFIKNEKKDLIEIKPLPHSWETTLEEMKKREPFNLWQGKNNEVQKKLWQLARLAYNVIEDNQGDSNYAWARWHFVRGLASCTFWWASAKDFKLFSNISWSPDEIERGVNEFVRAIRALENEDTRETKMKAEKLWIDIKKIIWEMHWTYYWKRKK